MTNVVKIVEIVTLECRDLRKGYACRINAMKRGKKLATQNRSATEGFLGKRTRGSNAQSNCEMKRRNMPSKYPNQVPQISTQTNENLCLPMPLFQTVNTPNAIAARAKKIGNQFVTRYARFPFHCAGKYARVITRAATSVSLGESLPKSVSWNHGPRLEQKGSLGVLITLIAFRIRTCN